MIHLLIVCGFFFVQGIAGETGMSENVLESIKTFRLNGDIVGLNEKTADFRTGEHRKTPEKSLEIWIAIFNALEEKMDPTFNPEKRAFRNLEPPPGSGAQAGENPSSIRNPELRKQYEAAIQKNQEYARYYSAQVRYRERKAGYTKDLEHFLRRSFTTRPSISAAVDILRHGLREKRFAEILAKGLESDLKNPESNR